MTNLIVKNVPVLRFGRRADRDDMIIPPECHVTFRSKIIPVCYDFNDQQVGTATITRKGNLLIANMKLITLMPELSKAVAIIQQLTPALGFIVKDCFMVKDRDVTTVLALEVLSIGLCPGGNADVSILPIGDRLTFGTKGRN